MVKKHDWLVLLGFFLLAFCLPLATNLVKQSQDDRSRASETASTSKVSFKIAFKGVKPSYSCLSSLTKVKVEVANKTTNTSQSDINTSVTPVSGETNTEGDQVFLVSNLVLDSKFNNVNNFNYLRIKGPNHLASRLCLNNQSTKLDEVTTCEINLKNTNTTTYNFSNYSLIPGDINQDGVINSSDYSIIKNNFNSETITCNQTGDLNFDGIVNSLDANLLKDSLSEQEEGEIGSIDTTTETNNESDSDVATDQSDENTEESSEALSDDTPDDEEDTSTITPTTTITPTPTPDTTVYDPKVPSKFDSDKSDTSDTLKVWTTSYSGYYVVRIWAKNPYEQFHQYSAKMSGKKYDTIKNLFNAALSKNKNGIKTKIAVAFNSDPSVYYGGYYFCRHSSNKSCPWNSYTSGGLIVREGEIYRNDTKSNGHRRLTYTITKDNKMIVLVDKQNFSNSQARVDAYKPAIDGQARNTGIALHILMDDRKKLSKKNNPKKYAQLYEVNSKASAYRTAMCQVDNNNFIYLITTSKTEAFLANKMSSLGCNIAVNIDGGGSTNFWFKKNTSGSWKHIRGSGARGRMDSIAYWTEL